MEITKKSPFTNKFNTVDLPITEEQYTTFKQGVEAELVFPGLSREHMLFIKHGISPQEHAKYVNTYVTANSEAFEYFKQNDSKVSMDLKPKDADDNYEGIVLPS